MIPRLLVSNLFLAAACAALTGCGGEADHAAGLEAAEILDLMEDQKQDPRGFVEVELGQFRVTHAAAKDEALLLVEFKLFAVVPETKREKLEQALPAYHNRLRDGIISLVQSTDTQHLADPSLAFFKSELVGTINRVLHQRLVRDVAFSDFSIHDALNAPLPAAGASAPPKKDSGGHGGHGH
jgi:flagellar basal body-associated protein FliL